MRDTPLPCPAVYADDLDDPVVRQWRKLAAADRAAGRIEDAERREQNIARYLADGDSSDLSAEAADHQLREREERE